MSALGLVIMLYAAGLLLLIVEIFLPSHGILTVGGIFFLAIAVYQTFSHYGEDAGLFSILACFVLLPVMGYLAVKFWRQTPIGRKIAPPNPVLSSADADAPMADLHKLVGKTGKTVSPLRPVGICVFDGKRISCVSQLGTVESGVEVVGLKIQSGNLTVKPVET